MRKRLIVGLAIVSIGGTAYMVHPNIGDLWKKVKNPFEKGINAVKDKLRTELGKDSMIVKNNPHKMKSAQVRIGNELAPEERAYLAKRKPKVKVALEEFLGRKLADDQVPTIAIVASGGGYRAMNSTLGWMVGADGIGLLNAVTYMTALSGSTWALGCWTLNANETISQFRDRTFNAIEEGVLTSTSSEKKLISDAMLAKFYYNQPVHWVDLYGASLANRLLYNFRSMRQRKTLSEQANRIKDGDHVFPIYTAVKGEAYGRVSSDVWYEFTPYEIGASWLGPNGMYVPSWAFGRAFKSGKSLDYAPEQSFGFMMGIFGSAFATNLKKVYESGLKGKFGSGIVNEVIHNLLVEKFGEERPIPSAKVNNFTRNIVESRYSNNDIIEFVDAGLPPGFNLPYPPVSGKRPERKADIIIFFDASGNVGKRDHVSSFVKCEEYAKKHKLSYPPIDYDGILERGFSIYRDEKDPSVPMIIYYPLLNDQELIKKMENEPWAKKYMMHIKNYDLPKCTSSGYCKTSNFKYVRIQSEQISSQTEFNMVASKDDIAQAMNAFIDARSPGKSKKPEEKVPLKPIQKPTVEVDPVVEEPSDVVVPDELGNNVEDIPLAAPAA